MRYRLTAFLALLVVPSVRAAESYRFTGRLNSIVPKRGLLFLADTDHQRGGKLVTVKFSRAEIVAVSRDAAEPWRWRSERTQLHRWPAGTLVVVIGHVDASGVIWADRIEIPQAARP
jgi:hypothetical protein